MKVNVVITPKLDKTIECARFRVVDGSLLMYSDVRMGQLLCGFKKWIRFFVKEEVNPEVKPTKKEK